MSLSEERPIIRPEGSEDSLALVVIFEACVGMVTVQDGSKATEVALAATHSFRTDELVRL